MSAWVICRATRRRGYVMHGVNLGLYSRLFDRLQYRLIDLIVLFLLIMKPVANEKAKRGVNFEHGTHNRLAFFTDFN